MRATEILGEEHYWIRHLVDCLEQVVAEAGERGQLDPDLSSELLYLFESFADGQHQQKEESVLFPQLLDRAGPEDEEDLRSLLDDHARERRLMEGMRTNLLGAISGEPGCVREFAREATDYIALHRSHMAHENQQLLPLADGLLGPEDDRVLVEGFRELEIAGPDPAGVFERTRSLCHRVGVPLRDPSAPSAG